MMRSAATALTVCLIVLSGVAQAQTPSPPLSTYEVESVRARRAASGHRMRPS
jgi:hypothetical protein